MFILETGPLRLRDGVVFTSEGGSRVIMSLQSPLLTFCFDGLSSSSTVQTEGRPLGECRNELLLAANVTGLDLPKVQPVAEHFPGTQAVRTQPSSRAGRSIVGQGLLPKL